MAGGEADDYDGGFRVNSLREEVRGEWEGADCIKHCFGRCGAVVIDLGSELGGLVGLRLRGCHEFCRQPPATASIPLSTVERD